MFVFCRVCDSVCVCACGVCIVVCVKTRTSAEEYSSRYGHAEVLSPVLHTLPRPASQLNACCVALYVGMHMGVFVWCSIARESERERERRERERERAISIPSGPSLLHRSRVPQ